MIYSRRLSLLNNEMLFFLHFYLRFNFSECDISEKEGLIYFL